MEVMNNDQFSQTETLIGQAGKTRAMGVSDDPMLMSMLSTGFYANPLRTMIQEVMFNAWDAHHMGNCQDKPIDIYINDTSGLIIRDYGPGISDDDMVPVYCIYGNSTKRKDKRQTGGFGLGCKSPFSYTESFTVTSMHEGVKAMYLVNRVSDDADGKPGLTPLVTTTTEETGLMVAIPLEPQDRRKAYQYIIDVLYLSGINANIHREDNEEGAMINVPSRSVGPGEYIMDERENRSQRKIYAVYGGVHYEIVNKDEYAEEFEFMNLISNISSIFIGFAPDTLTPLPNREGLNMSSKTKENIRVGLELCMERFQEVFEPLVHAYFHQRFDSYVKGNIEPHFALFHALGLVKDGDHDFLCKFKTQMTPLVPMGTDTSVWEIAVNLMKSKISEIVGVLTEKRWISILVYHFTRCYPNNKQLAFNILKEDPSSLLHESYRGSDRVENLIAKWVQPTQMSELFDFELAMRAEFPKDKGFSNPKMRMDDNGKFLEVVRHRTAGRRPLRKLSYKELQLNKGKDLNKNKQITRMYDDPNRVWTIADSTEITQFFQSKTVIIAKTVTALNNTSFNTHKTFSNDSRQMRGYKSSKDGSVGTIPAYVVHTRKGQYVKAMEILTNMGFHVIEADEPIKAKYLRKGKARPNIPQYRRIVLHRSDWQSSLINIYDEDYVQEEDGVPLTEPTHFLYVKALDLQKACYQNGLKPGKALVRQMLKLHPDIAMVTNQAQADALIKKGVKPFHDTVIDWYNGMYNKIYRFRNIVRVMNIMEKSELSKIMLKDPIIQAAMGIAKVKKDDDDFWYDMNMINNISDEEYLPLRDTANSMSKLIEDTWEADPMKEKIEGYIKASLVFSGHTLNNRWTRLEGPDQDKYAKQIARFIRTT